MVEVVIDTSAVIAVVVNEPQKPAIVQRTAGASLLAPASVHWEVGNAFSAMRRRDRITLAQAQRALRAYAAIPIRFLEIRLSHAVELASELGIYAYDAYLIAAAQTQRAPLLTLDRGLARAAQSVGVALLEVPK